MIPYQYTYIVGDLILLVIWLILFLWRRDVGKEMLYISLFFGIIALLTESLYIQDWWKPLTITGTSVGIEDFLFGFAIAGCAAVFYEEIFKKKVKIRKANKIRKRKRNLNFFYIIALMAVLFAFLFDILRINTLITSIITFLVPISVIYIKRKDLIIDSLATGIILTVIMIIAYSALGIISPGFIGQFWIFDTAETMVLGIPIREIIWYFLAGALIGPLYEYWQEGRLANKK